MTNVDSANFEVVMSQYIEKLETVYVLDGLRKSLKKMGKQLSEELARQMVDKYEIEVQMFHNPNTSKLTIGARLIEKKGLGHG